MKYLYRGLTTRKLYQYAFAQVLNAAGRVTINGELCVPVNLDGSIQRGVAGASPDGYSPGNAPSTWEKS